MPASHRQTAYYDDVGLWIDPPAPPAATKHGLLDSERGPLLQHHHHQQLHLGVFSGSSSGRIIRIGSGSNSSCDEKMERVPETFAEVMCHVLLGTAAALLFIALPLALWNWAVSQRRRRRTGRVEL